MDGTHGHTLWLTIASLEATSNLSPLNLDFMDVLKSLGIFFLAGLCEIGGGYLVWLWLKEDRPVWYGVVGGFILAMYGVVATWQNAGFGRVYAAYGGVFIVMALVWAWKVDGFKPDRYDIIGALIALFGVCLILYMPRR